MGLARRWAALTVIGCGLSCCQAFLPPCVRIFGFDAGTGRKLTSRIDRRCSIPVTHPVTATRAFKTRISSSMDSFSSDKDFDVFLAELVFSQSDVRDDVLKNLDKAADERFLKWLMAKIEACEDLEERMGLNSLVEVIDQVKEAVDKAIEEDEREKESAQAAETAEEEAADAEVVAERRTNDQVWEEMRRLQRIGAEAADAESSDDEAWGRSPLSPFEGLPLEVRAGYEELLKKLLDRSDGVSLDEAVEANYEQCDIQFLTLLNQKAEASGGTESGAALKALGDSINAAMQRRMAKASERLQSILALRDPSKMDDKIRSMAEQGEVDDALVLLLQANLEQAEGAGAAGAVQVLKKLGQAAQAALDEKVEPEKKLLRQLLRAEAKEERTEILQKAFRQRAKVLLADGTETSDEPEVTPPKFINVVKKLIQNFGNVGEAEVGFAEKLDSIITEAEEVATDLYGESQTPQEQQDRAWKDATVSVFDLEAMEEDGRMRGEEMPWANDLYDGMSPEMVKNFKRTEDGDIQIGGT